MARIAIRPQAIRDIEKITDNIVEQAGEKRAGDFSRKLFKQMQIYASQPNAGP